MEVLITVGYIGADSGPFDLYSNTDGYVAAFDTNVARADLLAGYQTTAPNFTTMIKIVSTGVCQDEVFVTVGAPTTTSTSTTTTSTTTIYDPNFYYDIAVQFTCTTCDFITSEINNHVVSPVELIPGKSYVWSGTVITLGSPTTTPIGEGFDVECGPFANCSEADCTCPTTTTTSTTTAAPLGFQIVGRLITGGTSVSVSVDAGLDFTVEQNGSTQTGVGIGGPFTPVTISGLNDASDVTVTFDNAATFVDFENDWDIIDLTNLGAITKLGNQFPPNPNYYGVFDGLSSMTSFTSSADLSSIVDISSAWKSCSGLTGAFPLINTSNATDFTTTWWGCSGLTSFPEIDTSSAINLSNTWNGCSGLTSFPLIDTSNVINLDNTWLSCELLTTFPQIDTSNVVNFLNAWKLCTGLTSFPELDFSLGTELLGAWYGCENLVCIDGTIDFSSLTDGSITFKNCYALIEPADGSAIRSGGDALAGTWTNPGTCPAPTTVVVEISNSAGTDSTITNVRINGQQVVWTGADDNVPLTTGMFGTFETSEVGVYTVEVDITFGSIDSQLTVMDSNMADQCFNVTSSGGPTYSVTNVEVALPLAPGVQINLSPGNCP